MVPIPSDVDFHRKVRKGKAITDATSPLRKQRGSRSACMDWFLLRCVFSSSCERKRLVRTYYDSPPGAVVDSQNFAEGADDEDDLLHHYKER